MERRVSKRRKTGPEDYAEHDDENGGTSEHEETVDYAEQLALSVGNVLNGPKIPEANIPADILAQYHPHFVIDRRELVKQYLLDPSRECTVVFLHPIVAQKSYDTEKRFITPPPLALAIGEGWADLDDSAAMPRKHRSSSSSVVNSPSLERNRLTDIIAPMRMVLSFASPNQQPEGETMEVISAPITPPEPPKVHNQIEEEDGGDDDDNYDGGRKRRKKSKGTNARKRSVGDIKPAQVAPDHEGVISLRDMRFAGATFASALRDEVGARAGTQSCWSGMFRSVFVNDEIGTKTFDLFLGIRTYSGRLMNVLSSENIKIISKPSRVARDGIRSGSYVALFNRIRAQTVSTRYLCASCDDRHDLEARNDHWDAFVIWLADDPRLTGSSSSVGPSSPLQEERLTSCKLQYTEASGSSKLVDQKPVCVLLPESSVPQKPPASPNAAAWGGDDAEVRGLCYNDLVVLEHVNTGMRSVPFVLRRTEGADKVVVDGEKEDGGIEPVKRGGELISQLHKIALEIQGEPGVYMQVNEEDGVGVTTVTAGAARGGGRMNNKRKREILQKGKDGFFRESVHDSSLWTIVSVEYTESTFYIPPTTPSPPQIPTTTPQVFDIHPTADGTLTLSVAHFPSNLEVYFGPIHSDSTIHQPAESSVIVHIPRVDPATAEELVQFERQCCAASAQRAGRNEMEIIQFAASVEGVTGVTVPILLVGDEVIYRTGYYHRFCFEFI
ncbi:hypothetical protein BJ742DRAFT_856237 [Cladochytrium replicatum]|nr:hypothetical protein BJ742DRAFT_856237 [Cladochytrium replicatum]